MRVMAKSGDGIRVKGKYLKRLIEIMGGGNGGRGLTPRLRFKDKAGRTTVENEKVCLGGLTETEFSVPKVKLSHQYHTHTHTHTFHTSRSSHALNRILFNRTVSGCRPATCTEFDALGHGPGGSIVRRDEYHPPSSAVPKTKLFDAITYCSKSFFHCSSLFCIPS